MAFGRVGFCVGYCRQASELGRSGSREELEVGEYPKSSIETVVTVCRATTVGERVDGKH